MNRKTVAEAFWNAELEDELRGRVFKECKSREKLNQSGLMPSNHYNTRYDTIHDTHCNAILSVGYLPNNEHMSF